MRSSIWSGHRIKGSQFQPFSPPLPVGKWQKRPKLTVFDPVSWPYTWSHTKVQYIKNFGFSWGKNIFLPLGPVTCSVFPEFAILSKIRVKKVGFCSHSKTRRVSPLDSVSKFSLCSKLLKNVQKFGKAGVPARAKFKRSKNTFWRLQEPQGLFPKFFDQIQIIQTRGQFLGQIRAHLDKNWPRSSDLKICHKWPFMTPKNFTPLPRGPRGPPDPKSPTQI